MKSLDASVKLYPQESNILMSLHYVFVRVHWWRQHIVLITYIPKERAEFAHQDAQEVENPSSEWRIDEKGWITDQNNSSKGIRFLFLKQNFGGMEMSKIQGGKGWRTQLAHRQVNMKQSWINQRQQRKWGCGANSHPDRLALAHRLNNNFLEGCGEKRKKKKKRGGRGERKRGRKEKLSPTPPQKDFG